MVKQEAENPDGHNHGLLGVPLVAMQYAFPLTIYKLPQLLPLLHASRPRVEAIVQLTRKEEGPGPIQIPGLTPHPVIELFMQIS